MWDVTLGKARAATVRKERDVSGGNCAGQILVERGVGHNVKCHT